MQVNKTKVLVISGPPGSGKTMLAQVLSMHRKTICLDQVPDFMDYQPPIMNEFVECIVVDEPRLEKAAIIERIKALIPNKNVMVNIKMRRPFEMPVPAVIITTNYPEGEIKWMDDIDGVERIQL